MKYTYVLFSFLLLLTLSGCAAIELVFKAGMWWAFFLIFAVVAAGVWLFFKVRKKKK